MKNGFVLEEAGHTETIDFWVVGPTERFGAVNSKLNVFVSSERPMFIALALVLLGCPKATPKRRTYFFFALPAQHRRFFNEVGNRVH